MPPRSGLTADQLAGLVGGDIVGPRDVVLAGIAPLDRAGPGDLSLLASRRYLPEFRRTTAGAVLVPPELGHTSGGPATRIVVAEPRQALARATQALRPPPSPRWGIDATARLGRDVRWSGRIAVGAYAVLGERVRLGANCVVGAHVVVEADVLVGDACRIGPHAVLHRGAQLGNHVVVKAGARIGGRGFGFTRAEGGHERLPQIGGCLVGDDVEIGANATLDRGSLTDTEIGPGTKIDNLVQIAHNVKIGARCLIMAQVGIAGSTVVEDDVLLAGQAGLADHLRVGRAARVAAQSGVIGDIPAGATVSGYPARRHREVLRQTAALARLTPLVASVERLVERNGQR